LSETPKPQVYFNSACPVCRAGIDSQREVMGLYGIDIEWIDINKNPEAVWQLGATVEEVRERLHIKDEQGRIHVGSEAFKALWVRTPTQRWLGSLLGLPILSSIARALYNVFARYLYQWNRKKGHW
jgi:predicted DCC family thiol-disulfide oxidoreductase YuxK